MDDSRRRGSRISVRFLFTPEEVFERIRYAEEKPVREGKRRQLWPFVVPFLG